MTTYDVFLSHANVDKPDVEALARRLRRGGLEPFLDKWHLIPGEPCQEALEEALEASRTCAVFVGAKLGPWQNEEMRAALDERVRDRGFRVIPVLLPEAHKPDRKELPGFLRRLTWIDFCQGLDDDDAYHRLVCGIRGVPPHAGPDSSTTPQPDRSADLKLGGAQEVTPTTRAADRKSRLRRLGIILGIAMALLTIAGAVFDLPGKWQAWRSNSGNEVLAGRQVLHGEVLDDASGLPLAGALVEIPEHGLKMTTGENGAFSFEVPAAPDARIRVRVSKDGFAVKNEDPMLGTGQFEVYRLEDTRN